MQVLRKKKYLMDNYTKQCPCGKKDLKKEKKISCEPASLFETMGWDWACRSRNET